MKTIQEILNLYFKPTFQGNLPIEGVFTDSRKPLKNGLFIALTGPHFDGHDFIVKAIEKGASAIAFQKGNKIPTTNPEITLYEVENPLDFYQNLAEKYLKHHPALKIAITGSSGKTTTKEFSKALLSQKYKVFATQGNLNNQVGVPFSALSLTNEDIAIFELGTGKPGDIKKLANIIKPHYYVVTSVGEGHLEFFKTLDEVAKEKASGIEYAKKGICFKNLAKYPSFKPFEKISLRKIFTKTKPYQEGFFCDVDNISFQFPFFGTYQLENFALALALAQNCEIKSYEAIRGLSKIKLPSYRQEKKEKKEITFYLDCYNANPLSMLKATQAFCDLPFLKGRKILILGDMLELGKESPALHTQLGKKLNLLKCDEILFIGTAIKDTFDAYQEKKAYFNKKEDLILYLKKRAQPQDKIFIKASRGMQLEEVYEAF